MQNSKKTIFPGGNYIHSLPYIYFALRKNGFRKYFVFGQIFFLAWFVFASCSPSRQNVYFQNLQRDTTLRNIVTANHELKIQKDDVLGISVASLSPDVAFYNASQGSSGSSASNGTPAGVYPVDKDGNITFIKLGIIHVSGMTRKQVKDSLEKGLVPYLKDVIVSVAFLNRHVTMLGGVSPQILPMPDKMTLLDAIAASGDIGQKGKINNVLVIRDNDSSKQFKRLSLADHSIFYSPYYYLQPNDIVYVEPAKIKTPLTTPQIISYVTAGISLLILILNTVKL